MKSLITQLVDLWGVEKYNESLDQQVALQVDDRWFIATLRQAVELDHKLHVFGRTSDGKIAEREDTGLCGNDAVITRPMPIEAYGKRAYKRPEGLPAFRWNPEAHKESFFSGAFEPLE